MTDRGGYQQFCPVSMAAEIICTRWTPLILRELLCGSTRFSDLRKGVPRMSPTLLSKRLKELEEAGVIKTKRRADGNQDYSLTPMGEDLRPLVMELGNWGHRWIESTVSLRNLDPSLLMWDMRRWLNTGRLPGHRCTIQFLYPEIPGGGRSFWLVVQKGEVDLCSIDPGFEVDLMVTADLRAMTAVWMGMSSLKSEIAAGRIEVDGDAGMARAMGDWLGLSRFAPEPRRVA
jgi:DNA-binding HxlR family transcriptional regulator